MKKILHKSFFIIAASCFLLAGCSKEDPGNPSNGFEQLTTYLRAQNLTIEQIMDASGNQPLVFEAPSDGDVSEKWILDIRHAIDFSNGHIGGANSAGYKDILIAITAADKPILIVDYTGEVATYVAALLRLYGYNDAQALKWGMSGWHEDFDRWTDNVQNFTTHENWTNESFESDFYNSPIISTNVSAGAEILKKRIEQVISAGYKGTDPGAVIQNPSNYFVNFYMPASHYNGFGHVEGAVQVFPIDFENLDQLNPEQKIAVCSYSGHTSAVVAAYLNVLGFDATNLKFGLNGFANESSFWSNQNIPGHWGENATPKNLPYTSEN